MRRGGRLGEPALADAHARPRLQVGRPLEHDARDAARDDRRLDHADRDAGHLSRHPPRSARAAEQLLPAVDDPRLPGRHERAGRQPRTARATSTGACACTTSASSSTPLASLILTVDWLTGHAGADYLIVFRVVQGIGAAFLLANAHADPDRRLPRQPARAWRSGSTTSSGSAATFIGLVLGGVLAPIDWRLVFLVSVPFGLFGTVWAYLKLEELARPPPRLDRLARQPHLRGRPDPDHGLGHLRHPALRAPRRAGAARVVIALLATGVVLLAAFALVERRVRDPMFRLPLFRIRAFTVRDALDASSRPSRAAG